MLLPATLIVIKPSHAVNDFSAIDKYVNSAKDTIGIATGTAVAIVKDGEIIYQGNFGYANIKKKYKVTNKTAFYLASITKPMFALSTLLMEEKGDIKETSTMAEMFPQLKFPEVDANKVQLKHLMSHTTGVSNWPFMLTLAFTGDHDSKKRHKMLTTSTLNEKSPLGHYKYNNLGYNIAGVWVEDYYQQDWQQTIAELIYQPLGMTQTSSYMTDAVKKGFDVARPYELWTDTPEEIYAFEKSNATMHSAGGTITTASDLARFLIAQLNEGKVDNEQVFSASVIKKSHQQLAVNDLKYQDFVRKGYAWGWYLGPYKGEKMIHHFGGTLGSHTHSSFIPEHNIGLVVLNNESGMSRKLTNAIADIAYSILLDDKNSSILGADKQSTDDIVNYHIAEMKKAWPKFKQNVQESNKENHIRDAKRTMQLTLEKPAYTGVFQSKTWGELTVELLPSNSFKFTLGGLTTQATAFTEPDTMRIQFPVMSGNVVEFKIADGIVEGFTVLGEYFVKQSDNH